MSWPRWRRLTGTSVLYLVRTEFTAPADLPSVELVELLARERVASDRLQREGVIVQLWRETGTARAWGVWSVVDADDLRTEMSRLPCSRYMTVESFPVHAHPNSIRGHTIELASRRHLLDGNGVSGASD